MIPFLSFRLKAVELVLGSVDELNRRLSETEQRLATHDTMASNIEALTNTHTHLEVVNSTSNRLQLNELINFHYSINFRTPMKSVRLEQL